MYPKLKAITTTTKQKPQKPSFLEVVVATAHCTWVATSKNKNHQGNYGCFAPKLDFLNIFMCKIIGKTPKALGRKCCCAVNIAYKRLLLYLWLPEVKCMFDQIVIDCQTQKETFSCGDCLVKENCHLRLELEGKDWIEKELEPSRLLVPILPLEVPVFG